MENHPLCVIHANYTVCTVCGFEGATENEAEVLRRGWFREKFEGVLV